MIRTRSLGAAMLVLAGGLIAGCGDGTGHSAASASPSMTSVAAREAAARNFVQCARRNGIPNFPDPTVDAHGNVHVRGPAGITKFSTQGRRVGKVCGHLMEGVGTGKEPNTAQRHDAQVRFAACMRGKGAANFPDPDVNRPDDPFHVNTMNTANPTLMRAYNACKSILAQAGAN